MIGRREFLEMLPELVHFSDEPLADLASVPLLAVCRLARQDVKVVLSGEGSDEVLAGYECGIGIENYQDVKVGDVIEAYVVEQVARRLGTAAPRASQVAERPA